MPYQIIRADITDLPFHVGIIVNTAREKPGHGDGTDHGIFDKGGPELLEERMQLGSIPEGESARTAAHSLNAEYLIHTVAPVWKGGNYGEEEDLRRCYKSALDLAERTLKLVEQDKSIAFPLIGSGNLKFPKPVAIRIAISCFMDFCLKHKDVEIYLVLFDRDSCEYGELICGKIVEYIDDAYVSAKMIEEYRQEDGSISSPQRAGENISNFRRERDKRNDTIEDILRHPHSSNFGDILDAILKALKSIDKPKITPAYLDKHGYISKQYLGKILKGKSVPGKEFALSIALGLRLSLKHTEQLIFYAGHRLYDNNVWDKIIIDAITNGNYDIGNINDLLSEQGQTVMLGSWNNQ